MAIHYKTAFLRRCVGGGDNSLHIANHVDFWASKWSSPLVLVIARWTPYTFLPILRHTGEE